MPVNKSFVLSATFPSSKNSFEGLVKALSAIEPFDFPVVEYYSENCAADKVANLMQNRESIFLSAALQKQQWLNPSSPDLAEREKAVELLADSMRFAVQAGAKAVLLNSGPRPKDERNDEECLRYLGQSLCQLHHMVGEIGILLEPGDRDVEYRHLIGHTGQAVSFISEIRPEIPGIGLVFDISHIAQLGEELITSWNTAKKYCSHVHLANCVLVKGLPYYGDKHPLFSIDGGVYSHKDASSFFNLLTTENRSLTAGIEMICPDEPEEAFFKRFVSETAWFFQKTKP